MYLINQLINYESGPGTDVVSYERYSTLDIITQKRAPTLKWFLNMVEKSKKSPLYIDMYLQNKTVNG
jgi:hypothetical protein